MEGNEQLAVIIPDAATGGRTHQPRAVRRCNALRDVHRGGRDGPHDHAGVGVRSGVPWRPAARRSAAAHRGHDRSDRFQAAMGELLDAVQSTRARSSGRWRGPFGPMPGAVFSRLVAFDGLDPRLGPRRVDRTRSGIHRRPWWQRSTASPARPSPPMLRNGDTFAAEPRHPQRHTGPAARSVLGPNDLTSTDGDTEQSEKPCPGDESEANNRRDKDTGHVVPLGICTQHSDHNDIEGDLVRPKPHVS